MSLTTFSKFYYGHTVDATNNKIDFDEGGSELIGTIESGNYTLTEYLTAIKTAMDSAGALTYTAALNRDTRIITISSTSNFTLRRNTGTHVATSAWSMIGFTTAANSTGASTYTGSLPSGSVYSPQAIMNEHIPSENWLEKNDAAVNESASGIVQVIYFGDVRYIQCNIRLATDRASNQTQIETHASGVANLRLFMNYAITKSKFEFMPDRDVENTFYKVLLEKTDDSKNGVSYKLKEMKNTNFGIYETGKLVLRVIT
jgi:hypothetical protein